MDLSNIDCSIDDEFINEIKDRNRRFSIITNTPERDIEHYITIEDIDKRKNKENAREFFGLHLSQRQLLHTWMKKSLKYRTLHMKASEYYKTIDNVFTYPIVIVSTLFGMGGFAMIGVVPDHDNTETPEWEKSLNYIFAMVNLVVAVLISIQKMNRYAQKAEVHNITAMQYTKFHREINLELVLEHKRIHTERTCRKIKKKYDELLDNAPNIPLCVLKKFDKELLSAK